MTALQNKFIGQLLMSNNIMDNLKNAISLRRMLTNIKN